jgi:DNA polymerase III gamma/tau subunit
MVVNNKLSFINKQIEKNKLSHAFLFETNNIELCFQDVKKLIKKIDCENDYCEDCTKCNLCKLIEINNLPSLNIITPDGMTIKRQQLEELETKFSTKPIYSKYNIYIILNADKMTASAGNVILKFLEEPDDKIIGFFITNNKNNILSTIKSRCEIATVKYNAELDNNDELFELATEYLNEIITTEDYLINKKLILSKYSLREDIEEIFKIIFNIEKNQLKNEINNDLPTKLTEKRINIIKKVLQQIKYNVNLELILDYFVIEMRNTHE